jgi:FlaA1/EpsC-like NDP-sugar epimerase
MTLPLDGKRILITGGTGSLGKTLLRRLLTGEMGRPARICIFSRDEAKQYALQLQYQHRKVPTGDDVVYGNYNALITFRIGDVRDQNSIASALSDADVVFHTAALKQVPACEYFPYEAVETNIRGAENIVRAICNLRLPVETVVGVSTDKAVKPVNVMGMTKAVQERIFARANIEVPKTRFVLVRYGNVLASRGSVIPLFHEQVRKGGPVTVTHADMTRFLLALDEAVDAIFAAVRGANPGETYVPKVAAARIADVAAVLIGERRIETLITGIRPGEKLHEILISEEEALRTVFRDGHFVIRPILPELRIAGDDAPGLPKEYASSDNLLSLSGVHDLLGKRGLLDVEKQDEELLA